MWGGGCSDSGRRFYRLRFGGGDEAGHFPVVAVAALLEAGDDAAQVGALAGFVEDVAGGVEEDVEVLGHDDIFIHFQHRVVLRDAV